MNWGNFFLRFIFVAIVVLILAAVIPALVALLVVVIPPANAVRGPITTILEAISWLWGLYHLFLGTWPTMP